MPEGQDPGIIETVNAPATEPVVSAEKSADDILKEGMERINKIRSGEPQEQKQPDVASPEPEKEEFEEVAQDTVLADLLKESGFSETSLAEIKANQTKMQNRDETFGWLMNNVPGFEDFVYRQLAYSKGLIPKEQAGDLSQFNKLKVEPEPTVAEEDFYSLFANQVNPLTQEPFLREEIDAQLRGFEIMADKLGFVRKGDIETLEQNRKTEETDRAAMKIWDEFPSTPKVKELIDSMNLTWGKDIKPHLAKIIAIDWGVGDPSKITPKLITDAFNKFIWEQGGGVEKIISNTKSETLQSQRDKLNLPKEVTPAGGKSGPVKPRTLAELRDDPKVSSEDILKFAAGLKSQKRR